LSSAQQFLAIIASANSDDAWSDCIVDVATRILRTFVRTDWQQLSNALPSLPIEQQQRIAYALSDGTTDEACSLLIQINAFENMDTSLGACDSLRAILETLRKTIPVSAQLLNYVHSLAQVAQEPWKTSCECLLKYLSSS
jgi:hypothetical protein